MQSRYAGSGNVGVPMILEDGMQFKPLEIKLVDQQFLELSKLTREEICGAIFKVPPHKIGILDNATFSNIEKLEIYFVQTTMLPWLIRDEQAMNIKLLTKKERQNGMFIKYNVDGLLRGDHESRAKYYQTMWQIGAMNDNEIRRKENLNPYDNGEEYYVPLNYAPASKLEAFQIKKITDIPQTKSIIRRRTKTHITRRKVARKYKPLIEARAKQAVKYETSRIKEILNDRAVSNGVTKKKIEKFYKSFPEYLRNKMGTILRDYLEEVAPVIISEIDTDKDLSEDIEQFIEEYIDNYINRHISSSSGQLIALTNEEEFLKAIDIRLQEWENGADESIKSKHEKIADREQTQAHNAIASMIFFGTGFKLVWRNNSSPCPYCKPLNGKVISQGEKFFEADSEHKPEGQAPMKIRTSKLHPPLHQGCKCFITGEQ